MAPWRMLLPALLLLGLLINCTSQHAPDRLSQLEALVSQLQKQQQDDHELLQQLQATKTDNMLQSVESQLISLRNDLQALVGSKEREEVLTTELVSIRSELDGLHQELLRSKKVGEEEQRTESPREVETLRWVKGSLEEVRAQIAALTNVSVEGQLMRRQKVDGQLRLLRSDVSALRAQMDEEHVERKRLQALMQQITLDVEELRARDSKLETSNAQMKVQISQLRDDLRSVQSNPAHSSKRAKHQKAIKAHNKKLKVDVEEAENSVVTEDISEDLLKFFSANNHHHLRHPGGSEDGGGGDNRVKTALEEIHIAVRHLYGEQERLKEQVLHVQNNHSMLTGDVRHLWGRVGDLLNVSHSTNARHTTTDKSLGDLRSRLQVLEDRVKMTDRAVSNLSSTASSIDKLHASTVQLFESMEKLEDEYGNSYQELRREVSKLEFNMGQVSSTLDVLKEDESSHFEDVKGTRNDVSIVRQRLDTHDARLAVLQSEIAAVGTSKGTEDLRESLLDYKISNLESRLATLAHSSLAQEGVVNDTFRKLDGKAGLEHVTKWAESADGLSEALRNVSDRVALLEDNIQILATHLPNDCSEVDRYTSGISAIYPKVPGGPLRVYCDMDSSGGGWTVIQRRVDTTEDYNLDWASYKHGFGHLESNFWLGNDALFRLTSSTGPSRPWLARFEMTDNSGRLFLADYSHFSVGDETTGYKLDVSGYSGNASDALKFHDGTRFSTRDADNDESAGVHCARQYEGGWWYSHCQHVNINGKYNIGLTWFDVANNEWLQLSRVQVKVRPADLVESTQT